MKQQLELAGLSPKTEPPAPLRCGAARGSRTTSAECSGGTHPTFAEIGQTAVGFVPYPLG
ncbi:MAG: hypothetical protein KME26_27620 [Oscillatoria princeps RMCB-10]|nr:hypothetical protein [Oscillatoria princeps RMCB-10]